MLHPSYKEMIDKMNETREEGDVEIHSRYSLVIAAAKRARQINSGSEPLVEVSGKEKNLSAAVDELFAGKVHIIEGDAPQEEYSEIPENKVSNIWGAFDETDDAESEDDPDYQDDDDQDEEDQDEAPDEEDSADTEVF